MDVYATVGLPYSGKSSWAVRQNLPIASPDAMRLALTGQRFVAALEPLVWMNCHYMLDALAHAGHQEAIVDATNSSPKRRREWTDRHPECIFYWVVFTTAPEDCRYRASQKGDTEIGPIIDRMAANWDLSDIESSRGYEKTPSAGVLYNPDGPGRAYVSGEEI